jgi:O-antigen/teichoic acid export membrane protein
VGAAVTVAVNLLFVPLYGYVAAAWAHVACYLSMVLVSYFIGQKLYPVKYEKWKIMFYILLAVVLLFMSRIVSGDNANMNIVFDTALLFIFFAVIEIKDNFFTLFLKRRK